VISCGPGWYPLIATLHKELCELDVHHEVHQVKEKYGTLRYYAESQSEDAAIGKQFDALIAEAETRSSITCEWCGNLGQLAESGTDDNRWYKTLCSQCIEISAERGRRYSPRTAQ
jgi:hypothetical protein